MNIVFIGATDEVVEIVKRLLDQGHDITVIDSDSKRIEIVRREFDIPTYVVDVLSYEAYREIGVDRADIVIASYPEDVVNIAICTYAKSLNIGRIVAIVSNERVANAIIKSGIATDVIIRSKEVADRVMGMIYGIDIAHLGGSKAVIVIDTNRVGKYIGKKVGDIVGDGREVLAIIDSENRVLRNIGEDYEIRKGDRIVLYTDLKDFEEII